MSEFTPEVETIARAMEWLTTSADTHSGRLKGNVYMVREGATTDDGTTLAPRGIHFGRTETFTRSGRMMSSSSVVLLNQGDRSSYEDYIPVTCLPQLEDRRLGRGANEAVDISQLQLFPDAKLARMAANVRTVLAHYGVELG